MISYSRDKNNASTLNNILLENQFEREKFFYRAFTDL